MGVSTSPAQLSRKFEGLARDIGNTRFPLNAAALAAKQAFIAAESGSIGRKPAGKRKLINVRYDIKGQGNQASAVVYFTGAAHLLLNPTRSHEILPRRRPGVRTRRRQAARALTINGSLRARASHPGTAGKDPGARRAKIAAAKVAPKAYARAGLSEPLRRNF